MVDHKNVRKTEDCRKSKISKTMKTEPNGSNNETFYFFKEEFINESNAFTKYYEAIKKNGYISKIIQQIEDMEDFCDLFNNVSKTDINQPINCFCDPIPENEENKTILYASRHVKLMNSPIKGRCLIADCGIPKNKVLIQEPPTVLQVNPLCYCVGNKEASIYRCHNCGTACRIFFTCDGCNVCIFCSRDCLIEAYRSYHRYECYGIQRHFWSMDDTDYSYLSMRMLMYAASKKFVTDPVDSKYGNNKNNYPFIHKLESCFNKLPWPKINKILYSSVKNLIYLISKTTFFHEYKGENYDLYDLYLYVGGLMVKYYCQAQTSSILLKFFNMSAGFGLNVVSGSGKAICPTIALLNHSCSPNATIVLYSGFIVVKSLKPIRKGEEITVCYNEVNPLLPVTERQMITKELFHFTCNCSFCEYERIWLDAPYKCELCMNGNAKKVDLEDGKSMTYCLKCHKYFSLDNIIENIKAAQICRNLYNATSVVDHVTRIAECYTNIFPSNSLHLQDVYRLLYEKHILSEEKPMEAIKYGLLCFNILEHHISRLHLPLLVAKVKFVIRALNMKTFSGTKNVSDSEFETMKIFVGEAMKIKEDLKFYLPEERISFHRDLLIRVHQLFQAMKVQ